MTGPAVDAVTYVGHATVLAELGGARLLTDPVLRSRVGPLRRHGAPAPPLRAQGVDAVLVSHLHRDHADLPSLRRLGRQAPLLVPAGAGRFFTRRGFESVLELAPGDSAPVGGVTVEALPAVHDGGRRRSRGGLAIGFLLATPARRVYFAGDTDLFDGMAELRGVDVALLPIWGWGPSLGPGHMDPERAARAAALIEPRLVVPIHWGTLYPRFLERLRPEPLRSPPLRLAAAMRRLAPRTELRVLAPGESTQLP